MEYSDESEDDNGNVDAHTTVEDDHDDMEICSIATATSFIRL